MQASILDLRLRLPEVLRALDRQERVTIYYQGKERAVLIPANMRTAKRGRRSASTHAAFGMWADRDDLAGVPSMVRNLRKNREHAL